MKGLSFIFALVCLLQATILPACIRQSSVFGLDPTETGACHEREHGCSSESESGDGGCGSVCSPFQSCSCCQVSFTQALEIKAIEISSHTFLTTLVESSLTKCDLPNRFPDLPKQPPKFRSI